MPLLFVVDILDIVPRTSVW